MRHARTMSASTYKHHGCSVRQPCCAACRALLKFSVCALAHFCINWAKRRPGRHTGSICLKVASAHVRRQVSDATHAQSSEEASQRTSSPSLKYPMQNARPPSGRRAGGQCKSLRRQKLHPTQAKSISPSTSHPTDPENHQLAESERPMFLKMESSRQGVLREAPRDAIKHNRRRRQRPW
jgi:hypothetical protein